MLPAYRSREDASPAHTDERPAPPTGPPWSPKPAPLRDWQPEDRVERVEVPGPNGAQVTVERNLELGETRIVT